MYQNVPFLRFRFSVLLIHKPFLEDFRTLARRAPRIPDFIEAFLFGW